MTERQVLFTLTVDDCQAVLRAIDASDLDDTNQLKVFTDEEESDIKYLNNEARVRMAHHAIIIKKIDDALGADFRVARGINNG